jgi:hypothetical protein
MRIRFVDTISIMNDLLAYGCREKAASRLRLKFSK